MGLFHIVGEVKLGMSLSVSLCLWAEKTLFPNSGKRSKDQTFLVTCVSTIEWRAEATKAWSSLSHYMLMMMMFLFLFA